MGKMAYIVAISVNNYGYSDHMDDHNSDEFDHGGFEFLAWDGGRDAQRPDV